MHPVAAVFFFFWEKGNISIVRMSFIISYFFFCAWIKFLIAQPKWFMFHSRSFLFAKQNKKKSIFKENAREIDKRVKKLNSARERKIIVIKCQSRSNVFQMIWDANEWMFLITKNLFWKNHLIPLEWMFRIFLIHFQDNEPNIPLHWADAKHFESQK